MADFEKHVYFVSNGLTTTLFKQYLSCFSKPKGVPRNKTSTSQYVV